MLEFTNMNSNVKQFVYTNCEKFELYEKKLWRVNELITQLTYLIVPTCYFNNHILQIQPLLPLLKNPYRLGSM